MTENHQIIPFALPEHLAQFLAHKLRNPYERLPEGNFINVDRYSFFGSLLHKMLETSPSPDKNQDANCYLRFGDHSGDNYPGTPRGKRGFLMIPKAYLNRIEIMLSDDFDEAAINFIEGAVFAHKKNGWDPSQKRNGIRDSAIFEFCEERGVNTERKTIERIRKMHQRFKKNQGNVLHKTFSKMGGSLSYK